MNWYSTILLLLSYCWNGEVFSLWQTLNSGVSHCQTLKEKQTWCLTSTETVRLIRDGEKGGKGMEVGEEGDYIYLSLHCHHQNDSSIKMGSDKRHLIVSLIVRKKSHKTVSTDHKPFWRERRAEAVSNLAPSAYQPNALPLGQTGWRAQRFKVAIF